MTQALPPLTPAGAPLAHSGEIQPPVPTPEAQAPSTSTEGAARIIALESDIFTLKGTVNQMAADMAELMALLKAPNRTSSNSTPPPGYGPTVDPNPWVPPTHAPEVTLSAAIPFPPSNPTTLVPPPMSIPVPAPVYIAPPPMVFPAQSPHAPAHTSEPLPFQASQPHISFSYPTLHLLNIPIPESGTPTEAIPIAPPTNFIPETGTEQEQRLKKMEQNIKALQSGGSRLNAGDGDWSPFPGMRLPPKIKVPEFQSLARAALDWYMSLKAADIPTWANLSSKFIDQYKYCAETSPTLLELSTMEMAEDQGFEAYVVKWRARAAKHVPPISVCPTLDALSSATPSATSLIFHLAGLLSVAGPAQLRPCSSSDPTKQASGFENSSAGSESALRVPSGRTQSHHRQLLEAAEEDPSDD
ncbi:hypothetical protein CRG98_034060 [Punica granatum]|uniref:Retrotransposon gag domain-containing protein n=1 Tax=Punica granatum TaxID=22663 RepID=A0A2I0ING2_PUNGR|nr:hypothetical protein CRG98_034060 [Punica granatum]